MRRTGAVFGILVGRGTCDGYCIWLRIVPVAIFLSSLKNYFSSPWGYVQLIFFLLRYVTKILGRYRKKYSNPEGKKYHIPHFYLIDTPTKILFRTSHKCLFPLQKKYCSGLHKIIVSVLSPNTYSITDQISTLLHILPPLNLSTTRYICCQWPKYHFTNKFITFVPNIHITLLPRPYIASITYTSFSYSVPFTLHHPSDDTIAIPTLLCCL